MFVDADAELRLTFGAGPFPRRCFLHPRRSDATTEVSEERLCPEELRELFAVSRGVSRQIEAASRLRRG